MTQCLKYLPYLGPKFLICIDSDYRRLTRERGIDARHHVLQTYTYSFENHHCFAGGLDEVCRRVTTLQNNVFDFKAFLESYSQAVYELFLWHIHFLLTEPQRFPASEFNELVSLSGQRRPDIRDIHTELLADIGALLQGRRREIDPGPRLVSLNFPDNTVVCLIHCYHFSHSSCPHTVQWSLSRKTRSDRFSPIKKVRSIGLC